ncbi:electron transporter RnfB [Spiribacter roseus]|nr:electron transporter RnfB [Spiribacter roseus]
MSGGASVTERIDALLPQTQCEQCGYPGCRPYAEAIAQGEAAINQCPPGGQATIDALAQLLDRPAPPLNPEHGDYRPPRVAWIDESVCIGCTKCIQACPVDAIVGARQRMHTVIAEECTGCDLCLAPCPVDCIHMLPTEREAEPVDQQQRRRDRARRRFNARQQRLLQRQARREEKRRQRRETQRASPTTPAAPALPDREARRETAKAALARVRAKRRQRGRGS